MMSANTSWASFIGWKVSPWYHFSLWNIMCLIVGTLFIVKLKLVSFGKLLEKLNETSLRAWITFEKKVKCAKN